MAPMVDPAHLTDLRELMAEDFILLLETYLNDGPRQLAAMRSAFTERHAQSLRSQAHSLKGASSNIGATLLVSRLQQLEDSALREDWSAAGALLPEVTADFEQVCLELTEALKPGV